MYKRLDRFADIHYGKSPSLVVDTDGIIPIYGTGGVYARASTPLFPGPAVIVPRKGSLGSPHLATGPFWASDTTYAVIPKRGVDPHWLYYQLCVFELEKLNEATGVPSISRDWLAKIDIADQDELTQVAAAMQIKSIERQITHTEALIAKQEQVRAGLMQDLFTRGVDETGRLRPPREEAPELYHETVLGWLPKGWEVNRLGKLASAEITYGIVQAGLHTPDGVPYIRTGDMFGRRLSIEGLMRTSKSIAAQYERSRVRAGETVIAIRATVGKALQVPDELDGANLTQGTARFSPSSILCSEFALWLVRSRHVQVDIALATKGTTFSEITLSDLRMVRAAFPIDRNEQSRIACVLNRLEKYWDELLASRSKLYRLRAALLRDLLTPPAAVPEPRIAAE